MAFGPVGQNFSPRYKLAGTYDQKWIENEAPFWPADFSYGYFQGVPEDQQVPFLEGGEEIELRNLTPGGSTKFRIPTLSVPVTFVPHAGAPIYAQAQCDTLLIEPMRADFR